MINSRPLILFICIFTARPRGPSGDRFQQVCAPSRRRLVFRKAPFRQRSIIRPTRRSRQSFPLRTLVPIALGDRLKELAAEATARSAAPPADRRDTILPGFAGALLLREE